MWGLWRGPSPSFVLIFFPINFSFLHFSVVTIPTSPLPPSLCLSLSNCPLVSLITHITSNVYTVLLPSYNKSPFLQNPEHFLRKTKLINTNKNSQNKFIWMCFLHLLILGREKRHPLYVLASSFKYLLEVIIYTKKSYLLILSICNISSMKSKYLLSL